MGWDSCSSWRTRADVAADTRNEFVGGRLSVLEEAKGRDGVWMLVQDAEGAVFVVLVLVESRGGELWRKVLAEQDGPCFYDVPVSWLARLHTPENEYSERWRAEVRRRAGVAA